MKIALLIDEFYSMPSQSFDLAEINVASRGEGVVFRLLTSCRLLLAIRSMVYVLEFVVAALQCNAAVAAVRALKWATAQESMILAFLKRKAAAALPDVKL